MTHVRRRHRGRDGRATCCRRWPSPRRSSTPATRAGRDPLRRRPAGHRDRLLCRRRRSRTRSSTSSGSSAGSRCRRTCGQPAMVAQAGRRPRARQAAAAGCAAGRRLGRRLRQPAAVLAARCGGMPVVVVSYDRTPGRASRSRPARRRRRPSPSPTRRCRGRRDRRARAPADPRRRPSGPRRPRAALGLPADRFVVVVTGGSQGSGVLNAAVAATSPATPTTAGWPCARSSASASSPPPARPRRLDRRAPPGRRLRRPLELCTPPPTCSSGGAGPAPWPRWPSPARRRSSSRGPARPRTTRPLNVRWLAEPRAPRLLPEAEIGRLGAVIDGCAPTPAPWPARQRRRAAGDVHRSGALAELIEPSPGPRPNPRRAGGVPPRRPSSSLPPSCRRARRVPASVPPARSTCRPRCGCTSSASAARA